MSAEKSRASSRLKAKSKHTVIHKLDTLYSNYFQITFNVHTEYTNFSDYLFIDKH